MSKMNDDKFERDGRTFLPIEIQTTIFNDIFYQLLHFQQMILLNIIFLKVNSFGVLPQIMNFMTF